MSHPPNWCSPYVRRCHSHICDITGLANALQKSKPLHIALAISDTVCIQFLSIAAYVSSCAVKWTSECKSGWYLQIQLYIYVHINVLEFYIRI